MPLKSALGVIRGHSNLKLKGHRSIDRIQVPIRLLL